MNYGQNIIVNKTNRYKSIEEVKESLIDLSLNYYGWQECNPRHSYGPIVRNSYYIHIIKSGCGKFIINGNTYNLKAGDSFCIMAGTKAQYYADYDNPWTYFWVGFTGVMAYETVMRAGFSKFSPVIKIVHMNKLESLIKKMIELEQPNYSNDLKRRGLFFQFMADLIDENTSVSNNGFYQGSLCYFAQEAYNYIKLQYVKPIQINVLAYSMGISRNYLYHAFKTTYGISPKQFLIKVRLENAIGLLSNKILSISEIARLVGFEDSLAFSKIFKKTYGISPTHYRKKLFLK